MKVFLDANILFSAARSTTGSSRSLFSLQEKLNITLVTSKLAINEAERNLREKESPQVLVILSALLSKIEIIDVNSNTGKTKYNMIIEEKDAPILYAAEVSCADYLLTLDKKHFFTTILIQTKLPFKIMLPGVFLKQIL